MIHDLYRLVFRLWRVRRFQWFLEMVKPDLALLRRQSTEHVTTSGISTTHVFHGPRTSTSREAITFVTGSEGQVTSMNVTGKMRGYTASLALRVLSYNEPVVINKPQHVQVLSRPRKFFIACMG